MSISEPFRADMIRPVPPPVWMAGNGDGDDRADGGSPKTPEIENEHLPANPAEGEGHQDDHSDDGKPLLDAFEELEQDEKETVLSVLNQMLRGWKPGKD